MKAKPINPYNVLRDRAQRFRSSVINPVTDFY